MEHRNPEQEEHYSLNKIYQNTKLIDEHSQDLRNLLK